ncbi:MAG: hypothetical protein ABMB14_35470, partial [Myxococcota bacterium]
MARFEEMAIGARRVRGPISDLVDLSMGGVHHVAVAFHDDFRDDPALAAALDPVRDFLELPMAEGVAPLIAARRGVFAYRVPAGRTVRELVSVFAEEGGGGSRAALELIAEALSALAGAAKAGADRGIRSHGSLDPWRLAVDDRGKVTLVGYGLPPLDLLDFQRDETQVPVADSLRYCPPERLDGDAEDWTSDAFAVALCAIELATGRVVYAASGRALLDEVGAGEAVKRLDQAPRELVAVVRTSLAPFPDQRPTDPAIVIDAARKAAARAPGRTLAELVAAASPYLADVEDDLAPGFGIPELVGPPPDEPQRLAAIDRATRAAGHASAVVEAMAAQLDSASGRVDDALDGVPEAIARAGDALTEGRTAAERAEQAADRAGQAVDAVTAEAAA